MNNMRWFYVLVLLVGPLACSSRVQRLNDDVRRLEDQLGALQRSQAELSARGEEFSNSLFILEDKVDTNRQYIATLKKNQAMRIVQLQPEKIPPAARAEPEPLRPAPPVAVSRLAPAPQKPAPPQAAPASVAVAPPLPRVTAAPEPKPLQPSAAKPIANPLAFYKEALGYYESGQWGQCVDRFARFARELPDHDYADNSLYWQGECYYSQSLYDDAGKVFTRLIESYPGGNKAPDALLKLALCYRSLSQERKAAAAVQRLLNEYPFSDAAARAPAMFRKD